MSAPIGYGPAGSSAASFQHVRTTNVPFEEVLAKLRAAIGASGLWVLHEIDPQAVLRRADLSIGAARQILFFHPDLMVRLLQADQSALLEAPLKFAVMELPDKTVSVRWINPEGPFARYDNAALSKLGQELAITCEHIATEALADTH